MPAGVASTKDTVEIPAHVAEVVIALIAVSPFLAKGLHLLRTMPRQTVEEAANDLRNLGRMGPIQRTWVSFLHSCRVYSDDLVAALTAFLTGHTMTDVRAGSGGAPDGNAK